MNFGTFFFFFIAVVAIGSALLMITSRQPVLSVLYMLLNFFCLALIYLTLGAQLIAVIQILVYAGGIMVLFLFVIMLLKVGNGQHTLGKTRLKRFVAISLSLGVLIELIIAVVLPTGGRHSMLPAHSAELGSVESIGKALYRDYLFPFEVSSVLLVAAIVGAVILAKKKLE